MISELKQQMKRHLADPFPQSIVKGEAYGEVDAVMIDADIYGWATRAGGLSGLDRTRLAEARDQLARSLGALPADAQPYYERLLKIANLALAV
ncbi:hypothetical protein Back2_20170 [Nocardioides baekrokdamisoli]|uniref:Uncharacterized protein n=1 Tax=Nocardioides baekrokdamisoli TaxID=1804624 RepID=A0A3G9IFB9_9ACTN|nr:hypothetical protein [Nocardioides baekrokdamisoli]BBH17730.1 hypothetical protein Back2_20170 [Nocardioides baekrokdamisoli]